LYPKWESFAIKTKVITTEADYAAALARVEKLMDAKPGTPRGDAMEILSLLIHDYEDRVFQIQTHRCHKPKAAHA